MKTDGRPVAGAKARWMRQAGLLLAFSWLAMQQALGFSFADVEDKAKVLASAPFSDEQAPESLRRLDYPAWSAITFDRSKSLWRDEPLGFRLDFFHPGMQYGQPVRVNVVEGGNVAPVPFSRDFFQNAPNVEGVQGFSGLLFRHPLNVPGEFDEFLSFLGASYFRALGKGQWYGLSARGLGLGVTEEGEEFPHFREFWVQKPAADERHFTLWALLDGPSVTGAYEFRVFPGAATRMEVEASLFFRGEPQKKIALAPLTSMYLAGENDPEKENPAEAHDSDGMLLSLDSGEWLFRPLANPRKTITHAFSGGIKGFGLVQRDRQPHHYRDPQLRYERRPAVWVAPKSPWPRGHIELFEMASEHDYIDNIGLFWVAEDKPQALVPWRFRYDLLWLGEDAALFAGGRAVASRITEKEGQWRVEIDFALSPSEPGASLPEAVVTAEGRQVDARVQALPLGDGWRVKFSLPKGEGGKPLEVRAFLRRGAKALTETWSYALGV